MPNLSLNYDLTNNIPQRQFHASSARFKAMIGAWGSGKTSAIVVESILLSTEYPGNYGLLGRKTIPELRTTTLKRLLEYLPPSVVISHNKTEREIKVRTEGKKSSTILYGPFDDIDRFQSVELGWFALDEAHECSEDVWNTLCGRLRLTGVRRSGLIACNPTPRSHWIYRKFILDPSEGYEAFRGKTRDNSVNLPPGYEEDLRRNFKNNPDWVKRFLDGEFGVLQAGERALPDFNPLVHVRPLRHTPGRKISRGWDFGLNFPFCAFMEFPPQGGIRILHSILGRNKDIYEFSDQVVATTEALWPQEPVEDFCDPSGRNRHSTGPSDITVLNQKRIYPKWCPSSPEGRARELRNMMRTRNDGGQEAFLIDPGNTYLIEGAEGGYVLDDKGKPKKDGYFDHGWDGVGYAVANKMHLKDFSDDDFEILEPKWSYRGAHG